MKDNKKFMHNFSFGNKEFLNDFIVDEDTDLTDYDFINYFLEQHKKRTQIFLNHEKFLSDFTIRSISTDIIDAVVYYLSSKNFTYEYLNSLKGNKDFQDFFEQTLERNDSLTQNTSLLKNALKYGSSFELVTYEKNNDLDNAKLDVKFSNINPKNAFVVYANNSTGSMLSAFYITATLDFKNKKYKYTLTQITKEFIKVYELNDNKELDKDSRVLSEVKNISNKVLMNTVKANDDNTPIFYDSFNQIMLVDNLDKLIYENTERSVFPLIVLKNIDIEEEVDDMGVVIKSKSEVFDEQIMNNALNIRDIDDTSSSSVDVITTNVDLKTIMDYAEKHVKNIYSKNGVVDMSETNRSNASEESLRYKFVDLDRKSATIEHHFRVAVENRIANIVNIYNHQKQTNINRNDILFKFNKNMTIVSEEDNEMSEKQNVTISK